MNFTEPPQSEPATVGSSSHSDELETGVHISAKNIVEDALGANKRLQLILAERAEHLEAELREADGLLEVSNADEGDDDPEAEVLIPGAKKAAGLLPSSEFLNQSSPFYEEAQKRSNCLANTTPHPIKAKDLETLANAVRQENQRLQACARLESRLDVNIDLNNNLEGLDWTRISERVSDASSAQRTSTECRVAWIGDRHPAINHAEWSTSEIGELNAIVSEYSKVKIPVDWVKVAEQLATHRTPIDCMRHGLPPPRHSWSPEADKRLIKAVETCGIDNWQLVARSVSEYATAGQCQGRWQKTLEPGLKRGAWTGEEDERLRKAVAGYGKSWIQVASAISGRTNDQCRERWTEHINYSSAKMTWSEEEDKHLRELVGELGKHWKAIGLKLGGNKTGQNCRLRYDKLNKVPRKFKNTPEGTPSLSVVNSAAIFNLAEPSQLVSTQIPEGVSTTFTFSTNLGQHSFSRPSNPSSNSVAVDQPHPEPRAMEGSVNANESLPLDNIAMCLSETTEQGIETSGQMRAVDDPANIPKKSGKKAPEISSINSTKSRPKPRPKASKIPGRALNPTTEVLHTPIVPIVTPALPQQTSSSLPLILETTKVSAPKKGTKRKTAENVVDEIDNQPQKKNRMSVTAPPVGTEKAGEFFIEASKLSTTLEASTTTIDMRNRASPGIHNSGPAIHAHESATDTSHLRRGRSRRVVETAPDDNTLERPGTPPLAKISSPPPKKSRGRPRKVQASS